MRSGSIRLKRAGGRKSKGGGLPKEVVAIFLEIKPVGGGQVQVTETRCGISAIGATREESLAIFWQTFFGLEEMLVQALAENWDGWDDERASVFNELRHMLDQSDEALREAMLVELRASLQYIREVKVWELSWRAARQAQEEQSRPAAAEGSEAA